MDGAVYDEIVAEFAALVKTLAEHVDDLRTPKDVARLQLQLRRGGQRMQARLWGQMLQDAVDHQQEAARICPHCQGRRHHQGVRPRGVLSGFGKLTLKGIYWRCPDCGTCGHSAEGLLPDGVDELLRSFLCLLGAALTSFDKAQLVTDQILGLKVDAEVIRTVCLREGFAVLRGQEDPPRPVAPKAMLIGSCDGTMLHTREGGWREVKAFRFEHDGGCYGGAYLERVEEFTPRLAKAALCLSAEQAGTRLFLTDAAEWISHAAAKQLPEWTHIIDFYHAGEHVHACGEGLYGKEHPDAARWSDYWCHRLKQFGAGYLEDQLSRLSQRYLGDRSRWDAVIKLVRYLRKHKHQMNYPEYVAQGWPIGSGPMESFCKQLGLRMKGPGMRWRSDHVTAMAALVSRWSLDPENASCFGRAAA